MQYVPKRPFLRMNYADCVKFCQENNIYKDEETKTHFEFGDDIPDAPERKMVGMIGQPVFMVRFPASMKSFYMAKDPADLTLTESVDVLMPGIGEIVGGSMRMWDYVRPELLGFSFCFPAFIQHLFSHHFVPLNSHRRNS